MALRRCPECQNEMSSKAAFCGHCGWMRRQKPDSFPALMVILFGSLVIAVIVLHMLGILNKSIRVIKEFLNSDSWVQYESVSPNNSQMTTVQKGKILITNRTQNNNVQFSDVKTYASQQNGVVILTVCGQVYDTAQPQRFIAAPEIGKTALEKQDKGFDVLWNNLCSKQ
jgi:hypothetical protein